MIFLQGQTIAGELQVSRRKTYRDKNFERRQLVLILIKCFFNG